MTRTARWQDWTAFALGLWLAVSPWIVGYESDHAARQFHASWFSRLNLVIALDTGHLKALRRLARTPQEAAKVRLLRSYDPAAGDDLDVPDPYYGGTDGFEECLEMVEAASEGLLAEVREQVEVEAV